MERQPWTAYQDLIRLVMTEGEEVVTTHPKDPKAPDLGLEKATRLMGVAQFQVDLEREGLPLDGLRNCEGIFDFAIREILAFASGVTSKDDLNSMGVLVWDRWLKSEKKGPAEQPAWLHLADGYHYEPFCVAIGKMGMASYGNMWRRAPVGNGMYVDVLHMIADKLKRRQYDRYMWLRAFSAAHVAAYGAAVPPCHGDLYYYVSDGRLCCIHDQRSGDLLVGVVANIAQHAAFLHAMAYVAGLRPGVITYRYVDLHIYERQYEYAHRMLRLRPQPLPTLNLVMHENIEWPWEFSRDNFVLEGYLYDSPLFKIPTPL